MASSHDILERFRTQYGKDIDLTLRPAYHDLLAKMGNPQDHLPPVLHVAGTNGKGSTCAFMRAILEAAGYKVHVYTSPHLVTFHERIRIAGKLISEAELVELLIQAEKFALPRAVSFFEASTAVAFTAFARHPADFTILEVGLGGRLDATNVVKKPLATIITRLSYDHREYLGNTIEEIAGEKAGIMREGVPCFSAPQPEAAALEALKQAAERLNAPLSVGGRDWIIAPQDKGFRFIGNTGSFDLPEPALLGAHQYQNAGLALAALSVLPKPPPADVLAKGLRNVEWPARLQRLTSPKLLNLAPAGAEIWLDGGHNDSAGEALAAQIETWRAGDGAHPRPLLVVYGMLTTKRPDEFLKPFAKYIHNIRTVPVPREPLSFTAENLAKEARAIGLSSATEAQSVDNALAAFSKQRFEVAPRILICGSLYLAGAVLSSTGA